MFYCSRLPSAIRAFRVDCRVKLISVSFEEGVIAVPRSCFVRKVVGFAGSPFDTTITAPLFSIPAVAEPSV